MGRLVSVVLASIVCFAACSTLFPERESPGGPFDPGRARGREGVRQYRITLDVRCDGCAITYWFGPEAVNVRASKTGWHETFHRTPLIPETVRVHARGAEIRRILIRVDGDERARGSCDEPMGTDRMCSLTAETVIGESGGDVRS